MIPSFLSKWRISYRNSTSKRDSSLTNEEQTNWDELGFLVLPRFFTGKQIDDINQYCDSLWSTASQKARTTVVDVFIGTDKEQRILMKDAPAAAAKSPYKVNDLYLEDQKIRELVLEARLAGKLRSILGGDPMICNTLNFLFGSQQPFHTDSLYMTPPHDLNLVATWIALEDCHDDAGPLQYYPGSHKVPPYLFSHGRMTAIPEEMKSYQQYMDSEMKRRGLKSERFCPKKGDVFIWHSQLYHGGSPINRMDLTRKSLVTHYFRHGDMPCRARDIGGYRYWQVRPPQPVPLSGRDKI